MPRRRHTRRWKRQSDESTGSRDTKGAQWAPLVV